MGGITPIISPFSSIKRTSRARMRSFTRVSRARSFPRKSLLMGYSSSLETKIFVFFLKDQTRLAKLAIELAQYTTEHCSLQATNENTLAISTYSLRLSTPSNMTLRDFLQDSFIDQPGAIALFDYDVIALICTLLR